MKNRRSIYVVFFIVSILFLLTGCPNITIMRGPKTTPKGKSKISVVVDTLGAIVQANVDKKNQGTANIPAIQPTLEGAYSYGITDFMDIQIRLSNWLYTGVGLGFHLVKSDIFDLSLGLEVGGTWIHIENAGVSFWNIPIYLLGGINLSKNFSFIIGAGYQAYYIYAGVSKDKSASIFANLLLSTVGFSINFSKISIRPQLTFTVPINQNDYIKTVLWNAGIGVHFLF